MNEENIEDKESNNEKYFVFNNLVSLYANKQYEGFSNPVSYMQTTFKEWARAEPTNIQESNEFDRNDDGTQEHQMVEEHDSTTYSTHDEQCTGNEQEMNNSEEE